LRALAPIEVERFRSAGYVVLRDLLDPVLVKEIDRDARRLLALAEWIDADNLRCRFQPDHASGALRFDCFDPVIDLSPASRALARDARIDSCLRAIYGESAHLFKDKLVFKAPGSQGYPLHQDYIAWSEFPESFVTVVIPIDPCGADNGAIELFPGEHRRGYLSKRDGEYHRLSRREFAQVGSLVLELEPGDVAVFDGFLPHGSGPNRSDRWRRQLLLSYNAESDGGEQRDAHYRQYIAWLRKKRAEAGRSEGYFR
jgi:ectoine hydroxylase-related dioxygenase (phytanoyl-CoA dioxygenase family)